MQQSHGELNDRARGWLKYLWNKATTPDDWSPDGEPDPRWDRTSTAPMCAFPRFDLSESSYAIAMMANLTPAWREAYVRILDEMVSRHTQFWAAVDWLTQFGPDPDRKTYPDAYRALIPQHMWGNYDVPGWTANGIEPWGLQKDPIGADGNLFFRGFFNLVLSFYEAVSGDAKWHAPFDMAGVDRTSTSWTHRGIAEFITEQWRMRPEGPHCENTKIWPYCLSAAGLGLKLFDGVHGTSHNDVYGDWIDYARKHYMAWSDDGRYAGIALYHDPLIDHNHAVTPFGGLGVAFYMAPQARAQAEQLYDAAVDGMGLRGDADASIQGDPRMWLLALNLAREFGDHKVRDKLHDAVERDCEPRHFGEDDSEFGYWFGFGEQYPRGQLAALAICADVAEGDAWQRVFASPDKTRFNAPTVEGVDFPKLGIRSAWNDSSTETLHVGTYAAMPSAAGESTTFRVTNIDSTAVSARRNGASLPVRTIDAATIEVEATVGDAEYAFIGAARSAQQIAALRAPSIGFSLGVLRAARRRVASSGSTSSCPCC